MALNRLRKNSSSITKLLVSILIAQAVGGIGAIFTMQSVRSWYPKLKKPSFSPPNRVFGPVWTILFTLMGISLFLVWSKKEVKPVKPAITVFGVQLGLNALWSVLFFGLKNPFLGMVDIGFLWAAIFATIVLFFPISTMAAVLLIPYIIWVSFAAFLNYSIWQLNSPQPNPLTPGEREQIH